MPKTYAPQLAKMLKRVSVYYPRHKSKIDAAIAGVGTLQADIAQIVSVINNPNGWGAQNTTETP
jgi:hypothetical protein